MALQLPPAVSVQRFTGGYKATSDYTDLTDTETNDSINVLYSPGGDLAQRPGSEKLLNLKLTNTASPTSGEPITGHFYFRKTNGNEFHIVGAGDSLFNYTSSTASRIAEGLTDSSNVFYTFGQIQDPRSASDDIAVITNGLDDIRIWTGSGTATLLSAVTGNTGVKSFKYMVVHKNRIYGANVEDAADVDAARKVIISGFDTNGSPAPHQFKDFFYIGGSNKVGPIQNIGVLNDQIIIYSRASISKLTPGAGVVLDTASLIELQDSVGVFAPFSLVNVGSMHIFLSERGIYAFDGNNLRHLSEKVDDDILKNSNLALLHMAKATYNKVDNHYIIYYPASGSTRNDRALIYDVRLGVWQPPVTGRRVSYISNFDDSDGYERVIYGDYVGYLYHDGRGTNDGIATGFNGLASSATAMTLTDATAMFPVTNDGLGGLVLRIYEGTGEGQARVIESNTSAVITLSTAWTTLPDTTSKYTVGGIDSAWRSKDYEFGNHDIAKLFRYLRIRTEELGEFNMRVHYIVDFNELGRATYNDVSLLETGWAWGVSRWGEGRWGAKSNIIRKVDMRNTADQSVIGNNLALRFSNPRANETFRISGFDLEFKAVGKR